MEKGPKEHHVAHPLKRRREISQDSTLNTAGMPDSLNVIGVCTFFHVLLQYDFLHQV